MDLLTDFSLGLLMLFVGFIVFDWARIWWYARRHGIIKFEGNGRLDKDFYTRRWDDAYPWYRVWTVVVFVAALIIACWHVLIALCWFVDLLLEVL